MNLREALRIDDPRGVMNRNQEAAWQVRQAALAVAQGEDIWWCELSPLNPVCEPEKDWFSPIIAEWHKNCRWRTLIDRPPTPDDVEQMWKEIHPDSERHN